MSALIVRLAVLETLGARPAPPLDATYAPLWKEDESRTAVPLVRIYGRTDDGVRATLLVHGVHPYLYVPFDGGTPDDARAFAVALDAALQEAMATRGPQSSSVHVKHVVHGVAIVKRMADGEQSDVPMGELAEWVAANVDEAIA